MTTLFEGSPPDRLRPKAGILRSGRLSWEVYPYLLYISGLIGEMEFTKENTTIPFLLGLKVLCVVSFI